MQRAEQQQAVRERNASARSATRGAQSIEHQQAVRERHASAGRAARAAQSVEQQQAVRERDASARRAARAVEPAEHQQAVRERDASARRAARAAQPADQQQAARRGARARRAGKQALHTADEVEGLVVHSLGAMSHRCTHCNALRFEHEKKCTTLCCGGGKMSGLISAFPAPAPHPLRDLLTILPSEQQPLPPAIKDFRQNIRAYNSALQMASTGLHIRSPEEGISMIAIKGAVHHLLGPLQPAEHDVPQFAQLYIIDSMDAQVTARLAALGATGAALHQPTLAGLQ